MLAEAVALYLVHCIRNGASLVLLKVISAILDVCPAQIWLSRTSPEMK